MLRKLKGTVVLREQVLELREYKPHPSTEQVTNSIRTVLSFSQKRIDRNTKTLRQNNREFVEILALTKNQRYFFIYQDGKLLIHDFALIPKNFPRNTVCCIMQQTLKVIVSREDSFSACKIYFFPPMDQQFLRHWLIFSKVYVGVIGYCLEELK